MSALAGIFNRNGEPVNRTLLESLGRRLAGHGPDGGGSKETASVGMVFRAFHTDRESRLEIQPLVSKAGHLLSWDGRLDNRHELISQLRDSISRSATDLEIVMASYSTWGPDFLSHLVGDFALSLWDPFTRALLLARDAFGTRPIYYQINQQRMVWSSD